VRAKATTGLYHNDHPQGINREARGFERTGQQEAARGDSCCLENSARGVLTVGSKKWERVAALLLHK
jgi:hypothetical protein